MGHMSNTEEFKDFVSKSFALREPSLLVVFDEEKISNVKDHIEFFDFKYVSEMDELAHMTQKGGKFYFLINEENLKGIYDFVKQYSTGAIDIFDAHVGKQMTFSPEYSKTSLMLIVTKDMLIHAQSLGFDILKLAGLTYQYE